MKKISAEGQHQGFPEAKRSRPDVYLQNEMPPGKGKTAFTGQASIEIRRGRTLYFPDAQPIYCADFHGKIPEPVIFLLTGQLTSFRNFPESGKNRPHTSSETSQRFMPDDFSGALSIVKKIIHL
ncbi:hypothetical protein [Akkermansia sp.]|uniref:hypothetical protein n=1 Tax=Akkermansia sp. TaxID=1872421 RepID=UPI0025B8A3FD|nr:hypothetical protein [Akkermansia sp.]MCD8272556.1 hypothetical protein [Akkermansia sp.]